MTLNKPACNLFLFIHLFSSVRKDFLLFEEADYKESDNNVTVITIRGSAWESTSGSQRGGGSAEWKKQVLESDLSLCTGMEGRVPTEYSL